MKVLKDYLIRLLGGMEMEYYLQVCRIRADLIKENHQLKFELEALNRHLMSVMERKDK